MTKSEKPTIFRAERETLKVTFLVFSGSSIMCVASAVDPLRAANRISGETLFDFKLVSLTGEAPVTTCGLPVAVGGCFDAAEATDMLVVVAGFGTQNYATSALLAGLRRAARAARACGGVEAGTWLVARAGLLEGRSATTHWEDMEDFSAAFPGVDVRPDRYVIDGPVFTSGGASPTFDLMLHLVRTRLGMAAALDVASVFIYDQTRAATDAQPLVSLGRLDGYDPRLAQAIRLMEAHVDEPLTIDAVAKRAGVTARTLESIFRKSIGETPGAYYLRLRLAAARRLVVDTRIAMADIAGRTGFSSAAAFSRAFSRAFGEAPVRLRRG
ncbi:GlxA family transcriptional regulator [Mesorhizobium sp. M1A.F.Ca.IN.020.03.2.1]|uniref:GlxA family transcriptional regulator n=1 Tax=unclassified Mesorhizobium TaxID=325217 RepID=UPI0007FDF441|nr:MULTISPECIES: GlxA family transcriptional regulator [unclassified Mesorhizobium]MDG4905443.1 GlxA family transcriptional regulator [Mesorhizobium sp. WSM4898]OBQ94903.1 AraC family transcriptional regulator [Mesorhizobium sp. AA23]PBB33638.1 GlxA family transcriptional regulator [Mesorhizobium sp. WSM3882]RUU94598.1 GlxA family transcriptional regulator [Mesorhizobium sp. M1A.F.Ca.IN.020.03.2.1]RUV85231.1 GlxA family transcriptional regulator [Mesorhizobium sp. M1A.F.Ca.IN.020.32.1.1]